MYAESILLEELLYIYGYKPIGQSGTAESFLITVFSVVLA